MDTTTQKIPEKRMRGPLNGVDVPTLFATLDAVKKQPEIAHFQFRATNEWQSGTHSRTRIEGYYGAGSEQKHAQPFAYDSDHPPVLTGRDLGPAPVEFLLHGLLGCLTAGIGNIAAARGIRLTEVRSSIEGDIDLNGLLGLSDQVRNGYQALRVHFEIKGDGTPEQLREIVNQSRRRSAVYDVLTNGVPITMEVTAG